jgi:hypothetical protein
LAGCGAIETNSDTLVASNHQTTSPIIAKKENLTFNNLTNDKEFQELTHQAEVTEGDFIYRLVSEKAEYEADGPIDVYAELEYIGDKDKVEIYHAVSPFFFPMYEHTRDYEIRYGLPLPKRSTTLVKGEPLKEKFEVNAGYSLAPYDHDFATFAIALNKGQFPKGEYQINGYASFSIENPDDTEQQFMINGDIGLKVR